MLYVRCAAFFDTLFREFLMLIPMGRLEDIWLAMRRREQREMKNKKSGVANLLEAQWCAAKPYREATGGPRGRRRRTTAIIHRLRSRREATMRCAANDALNNRTVLASTGKRQVEIERPFGPHGHGSMTMQVPPQQSLHWECSTCSTSSGLSLDGCEVRLVDRGSFEAADANMVPIGDDETPCLSKCRGS